MIIGVGDTSPLTDIIKKIRTVKRCERCSKGK